MNTAIEQEATLRIPIANVPMPQPLPPAHLVIQPQAQALSPQPVTQPMYLPGAQSVAPPPAQVAPHASAPVAHAPHMILSATPQLDPENSSSSPMSSARVQSVQYTAPPSTRHSVTAPDMSHRTPSEKAVIQALQQSRDFVETGQPESCLVTRENQGQGTSPTTLGTSATSGSLSNSRIVTCL